MAGAVNRILLGERLVSIQRDVDSMFDALLPVPQDARSRLVEAMRYAAIGGGKRLRPLAADGYGRHVRGGSLDGPQRRLRGGGDPCLFADP